MPDLNVPSVVTARVVSPLRLALLDHRFALRIARRPEDPPRADAHADRPRSCENLPATPGTEVDSDRHKRRVGARTSVQSGRFIE
jgi:hypothetical protein